MVDRSYCDIGQNNTCNNGFLSNIQFQVMFFQSLTTGSQQAQVALQRLTSFLENEGTEGRVSPVLQKRILGNAIFLRILLNNIEKLTFLK